MGEGPRIKRQVAEVSPSALNRAVTKAYRLTDENQHTEARRTFAKLFKYDDLVKRYDDLNKEHLKAGHLTSELRDVRQAIDETMEARIKRDYGEDTLRQIRRGL